MSSGQFGGIENTLRGERSAQALEAPTSAKIEDDQQVDWRSKRTSNQCFCWTCWKPPNAMVRTSGIRDKLRSNVLKELAEERAAKRPRTEPQADSDSDDEESRKLEQERRLARLRNTKNTLLSILPEPKNSSAFGPTIQLDKLLKLPERVDGASDIQRSGESPVSQITRDGMIEVDVSKVVGDVTADSIKELTVEKSKPGAIVLPKGKEKQKNQITYLAQLGKARELEQKEQAAQSRINKAAARSKYGW